MDEKGSLDGIVEAGLFLIKNVNYHTDNHGGLFWDAKNNMT